MPELYVAQRAVVKTGITKHMRQRISGTNVFAAFADHDGEFAFEVELRGHAGHDDGAARCDKRVLQTNERGWKHRNLEAALCRVRTVVEADTDDFAGL